MLGDRLLAARWLVWPIVAWGVLLAVSPRLAETAPVSLAGASREAADLEAARIAAEEQVVRDRLAALGVAPAEIETVLGRLTPEERSELAARAGELEAGGNPAAAILAIAIIVGLVVVLVLELIGRRVVSRP